MKDKSLIPEGYYCYTWLELPSKDNGFKGKIRKCPYFEYKVLNGVEVPFCNFLDLGGISNDWNNEDWDKIKEHFKTEERLDKELPLDLLWDACKECGVNED